MFNQKGFSKIAIIIIALILIGGAYFVFSKKDRSVSIQDTESQNSQSSNSSADQLSTDNWKTYRNEQFGFEFKYPENFKIIKEEAFEKKEEFRQEKGSCPFYYNIVLNNPLLPNLLWEAGSDGHIPGLLITVRKDDCPLDINQPLAPQALKTINELFNIGVDRQKISELLFPGASSYGWDGDVKRLPEDSCKETSIVKVGTKHYTVKVLDCFVGPIHPVTRASFIPANGFILTMEDEASKYQKDGIFDQILSTFKFTK